MCAQPTRDGPVLETEVLIVGGGVTGTGVMRDLALRGIHCLLIDRRDLNAGASGGNHGLLHSGGRYAATDPDTAAECRREADILKKVAPECIDACGGLFVAVEGDDAEFAARFPDYCDAAGIECAAITPAEARELEPCLSEKVFAAFTVQDATVDPFRITLENVNHARQLTQSIFLAHTALERFIIDGRTIRGAICRDTRTGEAMTVRARQVVNAAGAWAMAVARLAGCSGVNLLYSKGTLIISNARIGRRVINRLRPPGDGDILVPGGTVSLLGTTSQTLQNIEDSHPTVAEVDRLVAEGVAMVPQIAHTRFIRAFSGVRPLLLAAGANADGRKASRGFTLFDHESEGLANFATVAGGKLTTFRLMAEKTGDLVAQRLGNRQPCKTGTAPLPSGDALRWTEPGFAARYWVARRAPRDLILCECEMVPASAIDAIVENAPGAELQMSLNAIAVRSRVGKGSCQGAFCSLRVTSHLYERQVYDSRVGLRNTRDFVAQRFKGVAPVAWGEHLPQLELAEALHCALLGLDQLQDDDAHPASREVPAA
ncbi:MAG: anaerobic glycerol-3-phosphate dehydrogenase subunit A [Betaproteobacteria bacterium]|nr:MAG: anaerobic glycerol-3-phosphate dehydrogenase subunit A [Betaproteobacteria bacterium]